MSSLPVMRTLMAVLVAGSLAMPTPIQAEGLSVYARPLDTLSENEEIEYISTLSPGMDEQTVVHLLDEMADAYGVPIETIRQEVARELTEAYSDDNLVLMDSDHNGLNAVDIVQLDDKKVVVRDKPLKGARQKGDVFYTPATTGGINHGHVGIYTEQQVVVEAPGLGMDSRPIRANDVYVARGAVDQYVKTNSHRRGIAVAKANGLIGRPYNVIFWDNKKETHALNCSQLVWLAYAAAGLDIDRNGGKGVYPRDIRNSKHTVTYRKY